MSRVRNAVVSICRYVRFLSDEISLIAEMWKKHADGPARVMIKVAAFFKCSTRVQSVNGCEYLATHEACCAQVHELRRGHC
jgi:hypothetical protein